MEVEAERFRDLLAEERSERATADAAHDLADEVTEGERVVPVPRARLPQGLLRGERVDDRVPVARSRLRESGREAPRAPPGVPAACARSRRPCRSWRSRASTSRPARRGRGRPAPPSMCAHSAVAPFVHDHTSPIVSRSHARPVSGSAVPPHRSTTGSPSTVTHTEAPTSSRSAKFRSNSSRTAPNAVAHVPSIMP